MTRLLIAAALLALAGGCAAHVKPWQREQQARMQKQLDQRCSAIRDFEDHMWAVREGAAGGTGKAGGGCGCN
ncbi:MAG TPA: DUF4266 domain-containing protein [Kofleriaceae bacterium]|jgi:hypothetical protein|nr:DUF4266 domain-containing protein [Kofleriaceae bacterium]